MFFQLNAIIEQLLPKAKFLAVELDALGELKTLEEKESILWLNRIWVVVNQLDDYARIHFLIGTDVITAHEITFEQSMV